MEAIMEMLEPIMSTIKGLFGIDFESILTTIQELLGGIMG